MNCILPFTLFMRNSISQWFFTKKSFASIQKSIIFIVHTCKYRLHIETLGLETYIFFTFQKHMLVKLICISYISILKTTHSKYSSAGDLLITVVACCSGPIVTFNPSPTAVATDATQDTSVPLVLLLAALASLALMQASVFHGFSHVAQGSFLEKEAKKQQSAHEMMTLQQKSVQKAIRTTV